ncbi:MAG: hypothetical protein C4339_03660 [Nitrososphaerota archaeon]
MSRFGEAAAWLTAASLGALAFCLIWLQLGPRALPWWSDAGEWLAYAHGLQDSLLMALYGETKDA